jgi:16S rRNA (uracil1498-N3)-methyltransferase
LGHIYIAEITHIDANGAEMTISDVLRDEPAQAFPIRLAIAPPKNATRFEYLLEKATEIGVDHIYPILTKQSERKNINDARCQRILQSAFKQCLRTWMPVLHPLSSIEAFLKLDLPGEKYIASQKAEHPIFTPGGACLETSVLIGPEGDFTDNEYQNALECGFKGINLGDNRLRTETAGIVAVAQLTFIRDQHNK